MSEEELHIEQEAIAYAKANKKSIASELTDLRKFPADQVPVSVFMAGSPGAGKTEASQNLIKKFSNGSPILRIDTDEVRAKFPSYTGKNSHLFQGATSIIADKMHDMALANKQSFVFDGTLSNLIRARENTQRSLSKGRFVQVIYVYQDPLQAWQFVKARELRDGRHVPRDSFMHQYFQARENVNILKKEFGSKIKVDLVVKNIDGTDFSYKENIDIIDNHLVEKYNKDQLQALIPE